MNNKFHTGFITGHKIQYGNIGRTKIFIVFSFPKFHQELFIMFKPIQSHLLSFCFVLFLWSIHSYPFINVRTRVLFFKTKLLSLLHYVFPNERRELVLRLIQNFRLSDFYKCIKVKLDRS